VIVWSAVQYILYRSRFGDGVSGVLRVARKAQHVDMGSIRLLLVCIVIDL